ncbi:ATP-binding protein [Acinetobacter sp. MD2(2019)]|uniref:ATP-binding protein n=1 Tax=Acinetobacter sp. MD2(2019) TaxID=2605273 RepID=UPI002D78ABEE|nr:ATP-binding protein [Acinetobacter sp. MD2(2019)]
MFTLVIFSDTFLKVGSFSKLGTIPLFKKKLLSCQLLILDDFGLSKVRVDWMAHFISVIDKHTDHGSLLITSQYETKRG